MIGNVQRNARQYHYHIDHTYTNAEDTQQPASLVMPTDGPLEMVPCVVRAHMRTIASFFTLHLHCFQKTSLLLICGITHSSTNRVPCIHVYRASHDQACSANGRSVVECIRKSWGWNLTSQQLHTTESAPSRTSF